MSSLIKLEKLIIEDNWGLIQIIPKKKIEINKIINRRDILNIVSNEKDNKMYNNINNNNQVINLINENNYSN